MVVAVEQQHDIVIIDLRIAEAVRAHVLNGHGERAGSGAQVCELECLRLSRRDDEHALVRSSRQRLAAQLFPPMLLGTSPVGRRLHVAGGVPGYGGRGFQKTGFPKTQAAPHDGSFLPVRTRESNQGRPTRTRRS